MIVVKVDKYEVCDWLRKLDLNQRPTGYEFVTEKYYFFETKHTQPPYLKTLSNFNYSSTLTKIPTLTYHFCQSVKRLTKINCTKTAHLQNLIIDKIIFVKDYITTKINFIVSILVLTIVLLSQKQLSQL